MNSVLLFTLLYIALRHFPTWRTDVVKQSLESGVVSLESGVVSLESGVVSLESGVVSLESGVLLQMKSRLLD